MFVVEGLVLALKQFAISCLEEFSVFVASGALQDYPFEFCCVEEIYIDFFPVLCSI